MQSFTHLHLHSEYSIVDGIVRIQPLVEQVKKHGMTAVALTDQANIFAAVKFYKACLSAKIKPIFGAEIYVENLEDERHPFRLVLLAMNQQGYQHLIEIVSLSYRENQQLGLAIVKKAYLEKYNQGLIVLSAGLAGDIGQALLSEDRELAERRLQYWKALFPDRFYLEISRTGRYFENVYIQQVIELGLAFDLPLVATNDVRFIDATEFDAHEARVCIHEGSLLTDPKRSRVYSDQQYLRSPVEMYELFPDLEEALINSVEITKRCNVRLVLGKSFLPDFPIPAEMTMSDYFSMAAKKGLAERLLTLNIPDDVQPVYYTRLETELDIINRMGFAGYFLIVADFIQWSKMHDVPVGPGRGSGAGSMVAYALKITELDPIRYGLLFERFLNPERVSMPDFDIDFCVEGRDRVIDYVAQKYGRNSVSQIITFGTMAARAVIRDVGRVLGFGYGFVDKIAKLVPMELGITLDKALEEEDLKAFYEKEEDVRVVLDLAKQLEGITRNAGKHAGGVVIAPGSLTNFTALYCEPGGSHLVSQFDKDDVETIGLVKFDFLGLRNLTVIHAAVIAINRKRLSQNQPLIDIAQIPLDDEATFELLRACNTTAVFQVESTGMKDLLKKLQPVCFEDVVPLIALFRPGPLQSGMVDDFINRRHGRARIEYPHPALESVLQSTYGVILYQEQVMQIAQVLAGYSLGTADLLRRAMGKKKPEEMMKQREMFMKGAVERGVSKSQAEKIFDLMEKFADYGFNKSHSAAYGLITYQTAWLKAHYPAEYMAAVLSSDMAHTDKVVKYFADAINMGLKILPPDINRSMYDFTVTEAGEILFGLGAVKGVGEAAIENIISARNSGGDFKNLFDFCHRNDLRKVNKRVLEALIKSGTVDSLGEHRAEMLENLPVIMQAAEQTLEQKSCQQVDLFAEEEVAVHDISHFKKVSHWPDHIRLQAEKETMGVYLSGHPMKPYLDELAHFTTSTLENLKPRAKQVVVVAGLIVTIRTMMTKRGDRMAFVAFDDNTASVELAIFSDVYQQCKPLLTSDQVLVVEGEVSVDDYSGDYRLSCKKLYNMTQARETFAKRILISVLENNMDEDFSQKLAQILKPYRGGVCPICLKYQKENAEALLPLDKSWNVRPEDELLRSLKENLPEASVMVEYV